MLLQASISDKSITEALHTTDEEPKIAEGINVETALKEATDQELSIMDEVWLL